MCVNCIEYSIEMILIAMIPLLFTSSDAEAAIDFALPRFHYQMREGGNAGIELASYSIIRCSAAHTEDGMNPVSELALKSFSITVF